MPYIKPERRGVFDRHLEASAGEIATEGELNYCIYKLSSLLLARLCTRYDSVSICSSAMEHAKRQWYRRKVAPYEDMKVGDYGDT